MDIKRDPKLKPPPTYYALMEKLDKLLNDNMPLRSGTYNLDEVAKINELLPQAITLKPIVYLINLDIPSFKRKGNKWLVPISEWVNTHGGGQVIPMCVEWERQLWELKDNPSAKETFLAESNGQKSVLPRIVKVGYNVLHLQYFFTAGEDEVRCWTIPAGATAPEAAGAIHTDFERGFIKAEVVSFDDFKSLCNGQKSYANIKAAGKYRQEGRNYVMQDGDIVHFMFNVTNGAKKK